jgi:hydrogenase expression/formation protein HypD
MCLKQLEEGRAEVENQYARSVRRDGNLHAQELIRQVFQVVPRKWRGVGEIPQSGLGLREKYAGFDAERRFGLADHTVEESSECRSGLVLQGVLKPPQCPAFGTTCTPERRSHHGFLGGGLRGLLPLPPPATDWRQGCSEGVLGNGRRS